MRQSHTKPQTVKHPHLGCNVVFICQFLADYMKIVLHPLDTEAWLH